MPFPPDSPLVDQVRPSPNHQPRRGVDRPDILLLHYTGMSTTQAALERLCDPGARLLALLVLETADHPDGAGVAARLSRRRVRVGTATDINRARSASRSPTTATSYGCPEFPEAQIAAVIALCRDIVARWESRRRMCSRTRTSRHCASAIRARRFPGRASPPRVGLWIEPAAIEQGRTLNPGDRGEEVARMQRLLADYGYGITPSGDYDAATQEIVAAFQRHFRPARVDGIADVSTMRTLERLLAKRNSAG